MDCNCININANGEGQLPEIRHVYGNVLRLGIPLTLRTIEMVNEKPKATDSDFIPSSNYPVNVIFSKAAVQITQISIEATMRDDNVACIEDRGTIPVGTYDITVVCNDDSGNPYRFKQLASLKVVDTTAEAGIEKGIEYEVETWYLRAAIFLVLKGDAGETVQAQSDWEETDIGNPAFIKNKPTIPDVSNFATKSEVQGKADASDVYTKAEADSALDLKEDAINDLSAIRSGAAAGATAYQKPASGIPASDLADGVIPDVSGFVTASDVADAVADLVDSAPETLDTLNELAEALGDDPNFATTMTTALAGKVDKVSGKGLSTEDYTTAEKTKLANLATVATTGSYNDLTDKPAIPEEADLSGYYDKTEVDGLLDDKVDKVSGKGLSTNDYTTAEKTKLAGLSNYDDTALQDAVAGKVDKENGKSLMTDAERTKLQGVAEGADVNVQPNWTQTNTSADDYIKNKPTLATVATSGSYNDLSNKPTLFSGNYNDLTNKPTIPSAQVNADWNASSGVMEILNKPTIPTKFSDLVDDSDYITAQDVASIVVGSADVVITETASHINITFVTTSISFTPNTTMSLWAGQKVGTLTVSGTHLKQDITLTVPANFTAQVSGGTAAQSITIPQTGGEVTGVSVTITYTGADSGSYNGSITATSGSTTASVGLVYSQYQGATIIAGTIGTINAAMGSPRIGELNVSGVNLEGDITASVGSGDFTICATQNGTYGTTATISKASAEASGGATLFVKYTPSSGTSTASGTLTLSTPKDGSTTTESVSLQGAVSTLTLSTNSVSISTDQNVAATGSFTINGSNLTNGVTLALTDANSVFSLSKNSLTKAEAEAGETITVTYNSSAAGNHSGSIAVNWDGTTQTVSLSGTAAVAATSDAEGKFTKLDANGNTLYLKRAIVNNEKTTDVEVHQSNYDTAWNGTVADTYGGNIVIPATVVVDGVTCNVVKIAANAFRYSKNGAQGKTKLQSLTLPEGITTIGGYFLYQAQAITSVVIPSTVTTIGSGFCSEATNIVSIDMRCQKNPNFQTTFGDGNNPCCRHCYKLESFVIPDKVTTMTFGSYLNFEGNTAMTEITIGTDMEAFRALFQAATSVTKIYCRGTTVIPKINSVSSQTNYITSTVYQNAQVYVPTGYKQAYLDVDDGRPANGKVWNPFEQYHALIEYNPD